VFCFISIKSELEFAQCFYFDGGAIIAYGLRVQCKIGISNDTVSNHGRPNQVAILYFQFIIGVLKSDSRIGDAEDGIQRELWPKENECPALGLSL
jgi:hypothetical protein